MHCVHYIIKSIRVCYLFRVEISNAYPITGFIVPKVIFICNTQIYRNDMKGPTEQAAVWQSDKGQDLSFVQLAIHE